MSEHKSIQLGDVGKVSMCKRVLKSQTSSDGEIPFFKISTFGGEPSTYISKELYGDFKERFSHPKIGDILISAAGTLGKTVIYDGSPAYFQDSNIVWIDNDESIVLNSYLYYFYQTKPWQTTNGSTINRIYNSDLKSINVSYPILNIQTKVAKVLSDIDKKIELNNKINAELEEMAKLIYDYWFVQFDFPDANGNPYKSSGGKMIYNEELKCEIPESWVVKGLSEIAKIKAGGDKPNKVSEKKTLECSIPIYSNGIKDFGIYGYTDTAKINQPSVTISARGTIGVSFLRMEPFVPIIRLIVVTPNNDVYLNYLNERLKASSFENSGSVQKQLTAPQVSEQKIICPSNNLLERYTSIASDCVRKIELCRNENRELAELRDWLLPMLMNGQVTVKDA